MKKMFLVTVATVIAAAGFSQVRFGAQVIGNAGKVSAKSEDLEKFKSPVQIGFGGGVVADIPVGKNISLRPSLNFLQKKGSIEYVVSGKTNSLKSTLNYAEVPVNVVYTIPMKSMSVYLSAGPSVGYGFSGKMKFKGFLVGEDNQSEPVNTSIDAFKSEEKDGAGLKRLDISGNANAGIQLNNGLYINAGYLLGFSNLAANDGQYKNGGILLTIGFLLPSKK